MNISNSIEKMIEEKVEREVQKRLKEEKTNRARGDNSENTDQEISRRSFLKKIGAGAAGLGALTLLPNASALNVRSNNGFQVYGGSNTKFFDVNSGGPINVENTDLSIVGNGSLETGTIVSNSTSSHKNIPYNKQADFSNTNWNDVISITGDGVVGEVTIMCPDKSGNRGGITKAYFVHRDTTLVDQKLMASYKGFSTRWDSNTLQVQPDKGDTNTYSIMIRTSGRSGNINFHI